MYNFDGKTNSEINHLIDEYVRGQRNRTIMKYRFIDGMTYEKIAEKVDLSVRYTKQIVRNNTKYIHNTISAQ